MSAPAIALPGQETLLASWSALALSSPGAHLRHSATTTAALFPAWAPLNNAIVTVPAHEATIAVAVGELGSVYADAGVDVWALWLPSTSTDLDAPAEVHQVGGLKRDTTTLVMRADLAAGLQHHDGIVSTSIPVATQAGDEPVPVADLAEPEPEQALMGWVHVEGGVAVAGAWSYLHERDCGIYAVGTAPAWRRRGIARRLTEHVLADAYRRGARTATLQSTAMAQRLYRSLGFEPAGRYEEWLSG